MNSFRYFTVRGGLVMDAIHQFQQQRAAAIVARNSLLEIYGASGFYGNDQGIESLAFNGKPPEGWWQDPRTDGCWLPPKGRKGTADRENLKNSAIPSASAFSKLLGCGGFLYGITGRGFSIRYPVFEKIGDTYVLGIPDDHGPDAAAWQPPDDECVPMKQSHYWQLKEAQEPK